MNIALWIILFIGTLVILTIVWFIGFEAGYEIGLREGFEHNHED